MRFYYKTKDGNTGSTKSVDSLPHNVDKLIIRRYNGDSISIPYTNELILDCNRGKIHDMCFKCDKLSIYKPNIHWFHINYVSARNNAKLHSTFNTLVRLKLEHVRKASSMFKNTLCSNISTILDFSSVKNDKRVPTQYFAHMFYSTRLTTIPKMINPPERPYTTIFDGTLIAKSKLKTADKLLTISKKGDTS